MNVNQFYNFENHSSENCKQFQLVECTKVQKVKINYDFFIKYDLLNKKNK